MAAQNSAQADGLGAVLVIAGTRPEAIKMAPVVRALTAAGLASRLCITGQHRHLMRPLLDLFRLEAAHHLEVMTPGQQLPELTARLLTALAAVIAREAPRAVLVQGDTTSALAGALAAFYAGVPIGHVEAGLRSGRLDTPFPEEANRRLIDDLARWHFAPTERGRRALLAEGHEEGRVFVTGNTVVDALEEIRRYLADLPVDSHRQHLGGAFDAVAGSGPLVLVTAHRRESFGDGLDRICSALRRLAETRPGLSLVFPVHPNPAVREPVRRHLEGLANLHLLAPVPYDVFVRLMLRATLILTDSGGIQEEAPSCGTPVLVMRELTERPEGLEAGVARLIGTDSARIAAEVAALLDDGAALGAMTGARNPYGDGRAAERIAEVLATHLGRP